MKKTLFIIVTLLFVASFAAAQTDFSDYEQSIQDFATDVANSLPLNAAVGLNWSDAYIGGFPHLGIGATVGFSTIPYETIQPVLQALGQESLVTSSGAFSYIQQYGAPLPAYAVEARLGGIILPFDVGVKFGAVPPNVEAPGGLTFDYLLAGFDVRLNLIEENLLLPAVSVGAGYTRLNASIGLTAGTDVSFGPYDDPSTPSVESYEITATAPEIEYFWNANVIDLKAQASKSILFLTPYAGFGASIGLGDAGGAIRSTIDYDDLTQSQIDAIRDSGTEIPDLDPDGIAITSTMTDGWAFRAYGGVSFNLLLLKVDVTGMYDFVGQNYGLTLGTRIQL